MKLIWLNFEVFIFIAMDGKRKIGSLKDVVPVMLKAGIAIEEIEYCVGEFEDQEHNCADFGFLNKTFIFSEYIEKYDINARKTA